MTIRNHLASLPPLAFTHGGRFHADDVFSAALLRLLRPDIRIYRGQEVPKGFSGIVFDIGNGAFDHHDANRPRRKSGVPYAAFGLLWREYGRFFLPEEEAERFDDKFVSPLDLDDNTGCGNQIASLIGAFNPLWDAQQEMDKAFFEAVEVAETLLGRKLESLASVVRAAEVAQAAVKNMEHGVVTLERYIPWKPTLVPSQAEFVIFPTERGGYSLQCIPRDFTAKSPHKVPLPSDWWGYSGEELKLRTGVPEARFCHASGFMMVVESLEGAEILVEKARTRAQEMAARRAQRAAEKNTIPAEKGTR